MTATLSLAMFFQQSRDWHASPALVAALRAVATEVVTFESLARDDIGDAGIPAWGDGYLRGYHDAATDIREAITAALDVTP